MSSASGIRDTAWWTATVATLLAACTTSEPEVSHQSQLAHTRCRAVSLPWGDGQGEVGFRPGGREFLARGPQAVAIAPSNLVYVLDSENQRVVSLDRAGAATIALRGLAVDADAMAVASDGALGVYSPLRATVSVFEPSGKPAGEVAIDRVFRHTVGFSLGASRQVLVRSAYQETTTAGSASAPTALATELSGKREGAFQLADGRGLQVRAKDGSAELLVVTQPGAARSTVSAAYPIPGDVDAAMLVGLAGEIACLRAETVEDGAALAVTRRAICLSATTGRVVLDLAMAAPGPYLPAQELAMGGTSPELAILEPTDRALIVRTCEVGR